MPHQAGGMTGPAAGLVEVQVLGLPLDIWARTQEHMDGLLREFTLLVAGDATSTTRHAPRRLLDLVAELEADYAGMTSDQEQQLAEAADAGKDAIDLTYLVPTSVREACRRLDEALDEADRYCLEGEYLLTLATPADARAFRRWFLVQFMEQIDGRPARSWPEWQAADAG
ncbi:hypothetical protein GHK86_14270 [Acidimicrobiaceae bacterium USS-CC1]|uniref:Uncharacterized protein n=1 Tax=Acidiferrimicrobium australe TaxID=2664430 RepID=A0ABW9QWR0_9ACTN|nr:hypothetical protein [Acidiferrimicrobium australe]